MTTKLKKYITAMARAGKHKPKPLVLYGVDTSIILEFDDLGNFILSEVTTDPEGAAAEGMEMYEFGMLIPNKEITKLLDWLKGATE